MSGQKPTPEAELLKNLTVSWSAEKKAFGIKELRFFFFSFLFIALDQNGKQIASRPKHKALLH